MLRFIFTIVSIPLTYASFPLQTFNSQLNTYKVFCHAEYLEKNVFITAAHCTEGFKTQEIKLNNKPLYQTLSHGHYHKEYLYDQLDFSIIKLKKPLNLVPVKIKRPKVGDKVQIGDFHGIISKVYRTEFKVHFKGSAVCFNDSGKGAFNQNQLVGILSRGSKECHHFAYFTRADIIQLWIKKPQSLIKHAKAAKKNFIRRLIFYNLGLKND